MDNLIYKIFNHYSSDHVSEGVTQQVSCLFKDSHAHGDTHKSARIYSDSQLFHCFGCGKTVGPVKMVQHMEECSYKDALKVLKERFNVDFSPVERPKAPWEQMKPVRDLIVRYILDKKISNFNTLYKQLDRALDNQDMESLEWLLQSVTRCKTEDKARLFASVIPEWQKKCNYKHLTDLESFPAIADDIEYIAVDFETTGFDTRVDQICGMSFSYKEGEAYYISINHEDSENVTKEELAAFCHKHFTGKTLVYWNARFDQAFMKRLGYEDKKFYDGMILSYIVDMGRCRALGGSLKKHSNELLDLTMIEFWQAIGLQRKVKKTEKTVTFNEIPVDEIILAYACADADLTLRLFHKLVKQGALMDRYKKVRSLDHRLIEAVAYMEDCGIRIDDKMVKQFETDITFEMRAIEKKVNDSIGREISLSKTHEVADFVYNHLKIPVTFKTETGRPKTDQETMSILFAKYGEKHPVLQDIQHWRHLQKKLTGYVSSLRDGKDPHDGKMRNSYYIAKAITGRLLTSGDNGAPSIQNFPKKKDKQEDYDIRKLLIPEPGHTWVSIDYSNIEIVIQANYCEDPVLIEHLLSGLNRHAQTAEAMFGAKKTDPDWDAKYKAAKACNFALTYAYSPNSILKPLGIDEEAGWKIYNDFFHKVYKVWGQYKEETKNKAQQSQRSITWFGRYRSLEDEYAKSNGYGNRSALNHPIQGTCGDLIRRSLVKTYDYIKKGNYFNDIKLLAAVHDELNFSIKGKPGDPEFERHVRNIFNIMTWTPKGWKVPVSGDITVGTSWGDQNSHTLLNGQ